MKTRVEIGRDWSLRGGLGVFFFLLIFVQNGSSLAGDQAQGQGKESATSLASETTNWEVNPNYAPQLLPGRTIMLGPVTHPTPATHVVTEGENLHRLASYYYGNARLWWLIFEANRDKLMNPNYLQVGISLVIPAPVVP